MLLHPARIFKNLQRSQRDSPASLRLTRVQDTRTDNALP